MGSDDDNVYALNATNGNELWNYTTGAAIYFSSPAVLNGVVYIGSLDDKVYALNATNGIQIWNYSTSGEVESSPALVGGLLYIGSEDGNVYALNASSGAELWSYRTPLIPQRQLYAGNEVDSSPAVVNGVVYVGSNDGQVYALGSPTSPPSPSPQVLEFPSQFFGIALVVFGIIVLSVVIIASKKKPESPT